MYEVLSSSSHGEGFPLLERQSRSGCYIAGFSFESPPSLDEPHRIGGDNQVLLSFPHRAVAGWNRLSCTRSYAKPVIGTM